MLHDNLSSQNIKIPRKLSIATFKFNSNQDTNDLNTKMEIWTAWFEPCCLFGEMLIDELLYLNHVVFLKRIGSNWRYMTTNFKSSSSEVFLVNGVLKTCSKLLCNFIEITLGHGSSPVNVLHIFRTPFTKNTSGWLLLEIIRNDVKSGMDYSYLVAFIIFIIYLTL